MLRLFEHPLSPYAQKVKILLREKGIAFDTQVPDGIGAGTTGGEFTAANPRAEVPVLIDDDTAVFDSTIILEYIEEKWPEPLMAPRSPAERARARMIEDVMDTQVEAIIWGLGELNFFGRADGELKAEMEETAARQLSSFFGWLEGELKDGPWFNGTQFGWADICIVPYLNGAAGFGILPESGSALSAWFASANARPSVAETQSESVASIGNMELVKAAVEQGLFKRQYRDHRLEWMMKSGGREIVLSGLDAGNIRFTGP